MKKSLSLSFLTLLFISTPFFSFAWGKVGHNIVAEIAYSLLDTNTKAAVLKYLGTTTIEQASTWMDEVRSDHNYDYMKTWHYVDFDKGTQYKATTEGNIINALTAAIDKLEHRDKLSNDTIKTNLMMVFHLVGDLHMPLHIGYGADKGGNTIQVQYLGNSTNLHRVWDTQIIEGEKITPNDCLALMKDFNKRALNALKKVDVTEWINEPRELLDQVYDFKDNTIDQAYIDKNKPVIEKQLLIAGIRLAAVLTEIFKS